MRPRPLIINLQPNLPALQLCLAPIYMDYCKGSEPEQANQEPTNHITGIVPVYKH